MAEKTGIQLGTFGALSLSVISSVSIVICNKALISTLAFCFATTLTSWHLLVTFCSLHVAQWLSLFEHKPFDSRTVMGFGILNGISIGLLNLSLGFNSVGFYQMTKLAIIPCTVLLETVFLKKQFSRFVQMSLLLLLIGVGIATVTDLQLNALGSVLSLLAIVTTCVAQIMTNTIQKRFKVSSTQLLYQSCPYQATTLFLVGPFLDGALTKQNVFAFNYTMQVLFFITLSCLISVSVNFSTFLVIGKTSPVTYQVLGHLKTCLVLAFGYILLRNPFSWRNICGIAVAVVGMALYSYACIADSQQKFADASQAVQDFKESESDPLLSVESGAIKKQTEDVGNLSPSLWSKAGSGITDIKWQTKYRTIQMQGWFPLFLVAMGYYGLIFCSQCYSKISSSFIETALDDPDYGGMSTEDALYDFGSHTIMIFSRELRNCIIRTEWGPDFH